MDTVVDALVLAAAFGIVVLGFAGGAHMRRKGQDAMARVQRASAPLPLPDHDVNGTTGFHKARNPERFSPGFAAAPVRVPATSPADVGRST